MKKFSSITRVNSRHTSRDKKIKKIVLVGVIALVLLLLVPKVVATAASMVMTPIHLVSNWFALSSDSFPKFIRDRRTLIDELNTLKSTQSAQSGDRLTAQLLADENEELRRLLGEEGQTRIVAGVIGRPNKMPYDVLVLDKGANDGILEGAPVFIGDNAVVGIIKSTFAKSSVVELITTPGFTVSVFIIGPNIYTNAQGIGGGQLRVGVPQGIKIEVGNLVVLPGVDSGIYGAVSHVQSIPTQPQQYGFVSPQVPLAGLRLVSVGDSPLEPVTFKQAQEIVSKTMQTVFEVPIPEGVLVTTNTGSSSTSTASSTASSTIETP